MSRIIGLQFENLLKKPEQYPIININSNVFLDGITKHKISSKSHEKKISNHDIKGQINRMSNTIQSYSKRNNYNLALISLLKSENNMLIKQLDNNIIKKKNVALNQSIEKIFKDIIPIYKKRGYKIPDLTLKHNLFNRNPLIIETRKDVNRFYENHEVTKGDFIVDVENVNEKNFKYLKKVEKILFNAKKNSQQLQNENVKKKVREAQIQQLDKIIKIEQEKEQEKVNLEDCSKLKKDIEKVKLSLNQLDKQEKRSQIKIENNFVFGNLDFKKMLINRIKKIKNKPNSSKVLNTLFDSSISNKRHNTISSTTISSVMKGNPKLIKEKKKNVLLTSLLKLNKSKKKKNLEELYNQTKFIDLKKYKNIESDIEDYFSIKYNRPVSTMTLDNFPKEMDYEINRIKQNVNNYNIGEIWGPIYNRIGKLDRLNVISDDLENVDKHLGKIDYEYVKQTLREHFNL